MPHQNRVVIVTGACGIGCGRAISARFAIDGAAVVVSDIDESSGRKTIRTIARNGGRAAFLKRMSPGISGKAIGIVRGNHLGWLECVAQQRIRAGAIVNIASIISVIVQSVSFPGSPFTKVD